MNISISRLVSAFLAFIALPITAHAQPHEYNGHYYEVIAHPGVTWESAKLAAENSDYLGVSGHLATITSAGEDNFIEGLRQAAGLGELWAGGFTESQCQPVPGCGWRWINDEGTISTPQVPLLSYANWLPNEPNNLNIENHLAVGFGGFGWNDEGALGNIAGYVIEYDVPITIPQDAGGGPPIPLAVGADASFPDSIVLDAGAQIDVKRFEYTDDLNACGTVAREIFLPGNTTTIADAVLPAYLCGSPKFLVIVAETTGATIPSGTVDVENETSDVFPNNLYDCPGPISPNPAIPDLDPNDPQNRDVMAWQNDDRTLMPEDALGATYGFPGSVAELTFACGSSRGKGNSLSLYFVGLHINFGPGAEVSVNAALNHDKFVELTTYKIELLRESIIRAYNDDAISYRDYRYMLRDVGSALRALRGGNPAAALSRIQTFINRVDNTTYDTGLPFNHNGAHLMRGSNIEFMLTEKVIPFAP